MNNDLNGLIKGLHHITLVTSNFEINNRFYTEILGLRRVKLSVNQDDIFHRHLFYSDYKGSAGATITFFEWPDLEMGKYGLGVHHHLSYVVNSLESLIKWKSWLNKNYVPTVGPLNRGEHISLYLRDPDGSIIEIISVNKEKIDQKYIDEMLKNLPNIKSIDNDMRFIKFDHAAPITSNYNVAERFFSKLLGLEKTSLTNNPDDENSYILKIGNIENQYFIQYIYHEAATWGEIGHGSIHHVAMLVEDESDQLKIMHKLNKLGIRNSGIVDRFWFKSLYFRDLEGNLFEIATKNPGYTVDEPFEKLGTRLILPPWLESMREKIEVKLKELDAKNKAIWPPKYPTLNEKPEKIL